MEKPFGVDEKVFSKEELQVLNLSDVKHESTVWRGTSTKPHTLYRGTASMIETEDNREEELRAKFINNLYNMKKGDELSLNDGACHFVSYTSYDPKEAGIYADMESILSRYVDKRVLFEIDMPRDSHMYVNPTGYRSCVSLPVNNIYELIQDPKIIKTKIITLSDEHLNTEFLHVKVRLKKENLI